MINQSYISRSIGNSIEQIARKNAPEVTRWRHNCHILKVDYVQRKLKVAARGYSGPKNVKVQTGIQLGTPDNPLVTTSNIATIEMQPDGKWLCVAIRRKQFCATSTAGVEDVEVDTAFESSSSFQMDGFGGLVTPDDLFLPPLEALGELTLPDLRFTGTTTMLCGIPPCPDCAPDGYQTGMVLTLSASGCWVWAFRPGGCSGSPVFDALLEYDTTLFGGSTFTTAQAKLYASGSYVYAATWRPASAYGKLHVIDVTDPDAPSVVGSANIPIGNSGELLDGVSYYNGDAYVTIGREGSTVPTCYSNTFVYDVTTPSSPTLTDTLAWNFAWLQPVAHDNGFEIYTSGGTVYMIGQHKDQAEPVGSRFGFKIADITNLASPSVVGTAITPVGVIWGNHDYSNGVFCVERTNPVGDLKKVDIYNVSTPASPSLESTFTANGSSNQLRTNGTYLYIGTGTPDQLEIVDISTLSSPSSVSITGLSANPNDLDYCNNFLYIARADGVIEAFDVSVPSLPVSNGTASTTDYFPRYIQVNGTILCINGTRTTSPAYPALVTMDA